MFKKIVAVSLVAATLMIPSYGVFAADSSSYVSTTTLSSKEVLAGLTPVKSSGKITTMSATYKITGDGVRLRKTPSTSGTVLGLLNKGDMVNAQHGGTDVVADGYVWKQVYSYSHEAWGWVAVNYLEEIG